jgi:hypothetical protein
MTKTQDPVWEEQEMGETRPTAVVGHRADDVEARPLRVPAGTSEHRL